MDISLESALLATLVQKRLSYLKHGSTGRGSSHRFAGSYHNPYQPGVYHTHQLPVDVWGGYLGHAIALPQQPKQTDLVSLRLFYLPFGFLNTSSRPGASNFHYYHSIAGADEHRWIFSDPLSIWD